MRSVTPRLCSYSICFGTHWLALLKLSDVKFDCRDDILDDVEALLVDTAGRDDVRALVAKLVVSRFVRLLDWHACDAVLTDKSTIPSHMMGGREA
jgi:hypothetical protein